MVTKLGHTLFLKASELSARVWPTALIVGIHFLVVLDSSHQDFFYDTVSIVIEASLCL